jgi:hypothetical protein
VEVARNRKMKVTRDLAVNGERDSTMRSSPELKRSALACDRSCRAMRSALMS